MFARGTRDLDAGDVYVVGEHGPAAVVVGAFVILFDPVFEGLAISLMAGEAASLLLSRTTVPLVYFVMKAREARHAKATDSRAPVAIHDALTPAE